MNFYKQGTNDLESNLQIKKVFESLGFLTDKVKDLITSAKANEHVFFTVGDDKYVRSVELLFPNDKALLAQLFDSNRGFKELFIGERFNVLDLKAFQPVLVRDEDDEEWKPAFFSKLLDDKTNCERFVIISPDNIGYYQCIPYNKETEYLNGTNLKCPSKYINWDEEDDEDDSY